MKQLIILALLGIFLCINSFGGIAPSKLTCEYLPNPSVVDVPQPRLGWVNVADTGERGQMQTANQGGYFHKTA